MRKVLKSFFVTLVFVSGFVSNVEAAIINLTSCSNSSIQQAVNLAVSGDTVKVPSGTCTWTGTVSWTNKDIALVGAGSGAGGTVIYVNNIAVQSRVYAKSANNSRISGFQFNVNAPNGKALIMCGQGWRVDHNTVRNTSSGSLYAVWAEGANTGGIQPFGLIDNNFFYEGRMAVWGAGIFSTMNTAWADSSPIGTKNAVYIENNIFDRTRTSNGVFIDSNYGGKWVFRYNTTKGPHQLHAHSLQGASERGTRSWEIYGNRMENPLTPCTFQLRGGTGMIFGNSINGANSTYSIVFDNVRSFQTGCCGSTPPASGMCNGTSLWDGNTAGQKGWPCRDQIGRGMDTGYSSSIIGKATSSQPAYIWANRLSIGAEIPVTIANGTNNWIKANRDYYTKAASFNGTVGVGCGSLSARPATCTTGVGYWATNQSCTDLTGRVGANPSSPLSGTFYKCTATNTWSAYYTPYTFPHPLSKLTQTTQPTSIMPTSPKDLIIIKSNL